MRVLIAHKFWYPRGGAERVVLDEDAALLAAGHETAHFSTAHPENLPSPWSDYFAPYIELGAGGSGMGAIARGRAAARMFSNRAAAEAFSRLLDGFGPDVVHVHGIHRQISPSVLQVARSRGVPVVQTLHDAHKVCPADLLLRAGEHPCVPPLCGKTWYWPALSNRCLKASRGLTALASAELAYQRARKVYERCVTRFISPSRFLADAMRRGGWDSVPFSVVPNAVAHAEQAEGGTAFVFAGRLVPGKGVLELVEAAQRAGVQLIVAGEGPLKAEVLRHGHVRAVGWLGAGELAGMLRRARAAVVPSTCLEIAPLSVLEPMAAGVPVVASDIGGIPELVRHGSEGLLVPPGDVGALTDALSSLAADPGLARRLGSAGRERAEKEFATTTHLERLLEVYRLAICEPSGTGTAKARAAS